TLLQEITGDGQGEALRPINAVNAQVTDLSAALQAAQADTEQARLVIVELTDQIEVAAIQIDGLTTALAERDASLVELNATLAQRDAQIAELTAKAAEAPAANAKAKK